VTETITVYEREFDINTVVFIAVVALILGCLACELARKN
jgi:hypothetical protein